MKRFKVSIIIPCKEINQYIISSLPYLETLNYPDYEIIILPDLETQNLKPKRQNLIIIPTGPIAPAGKRDLAAKKARGEILAFIDDDAWPKSDWLKKAIRHFKNSEIAACGGPAITPPSSSFWQKVSASVFESFLGGGFARARYLSIGRPHLVDDWPTVNFLVRKDIFLALGGFNSTFWPGEDTKFCLDLIKSGYKIIYEPKAIIYHHRRKTLGEHLKQIGGYGLHRGYFAKLFPTTSLRISYFLPSLFLLYLIFLLVYFSINPSINLYSIIPLLLYLLADFFESIIAGLGYKSFFIGLGTFFLIPLTHLYYGLRFLQGLMTLKLKSKLR